jgi:hypothetical protein
MIMKKRKIGKKESDQTAKNQDHQRRIARIRNQGLRDLQDQKAKKNQENKKKVDQSLRRVDGNKAANTYKKGSRQVRNADQILEVKVHTNQAIESKNKASVERGKRAETEETIFEIMMLEEIEITTEIIMRDINKETGTTITTRRITEKIDTVTIIMVTAVKTRETSTEAITGKEDMKLVDSTAEKTKVTVITTTKDQIIVKVQDPTTISTIQRNQPDPNIKGMTQGKMITGMLQKIKAKTKSLKKSMKTTILITDLSLEALSFYLLKLFDFSMILSAKDID